MAHEMKIDASARTRPGLSWQKNEIYDQNPAGFVDTEILPGQILNQGTGES